MRGLGADAWARIEAVGNDHEDLWYLDCVFDCCVSYGVNIERIAEGGLLTACMTSVVLRWVCSIKAEESHRNGRWGDE